MIDEHSPLKAPILPDVTGLPGQVLRLTPEGPVWEDSIGEHSIIEQNKSSTLAGLESLQIEDVIQKGQETLFEDMLKAHIYKLIEISKGHSEKINTARTKHKKEFYKRKLVKNNTEIAKYLMAAERLRLKNSRSNPNDTDHGNFKEGAQNSSAA